MRLLLFLGLIFCFACARKGDTSTEPAQEDSLQFYVPMPEGWYGERFPIPIEFAPTIPLKKGSEEVRFTRDWARRDSASYWSYVFVWFLEDETNFRGDSLSSYLSKYYTGLVNANMGSQARAYDFTEAKALIARASDSDDNVFTGDIHTLDYMRNVPFVLGARVTVQPCSKHNATAVIVEISPQRNTHPIWTELAQIREGFRCDL